MCLITDETNQMIEWPHIYHVYLSDHIFTLSYEFQAFILMTALFKERKMVVLDLLQDNGC